MRQAEGTQMFSSWSGTYGNQESFRIADTDDAFVAVVAVAVAAVAVAVAVTVGGVV